MTGDALVIGFLGAGAVGQVAQFRVGRSLGQGRGLGRRAVLRLRDGGPMWEDVDTRSGMGRGKGGYSFRAALLPYLLALDEPALARRQQSSLPTPAQQRADAPAYYAQMLVLFGTGWAEGRFRFAANGQLRPHWG